MRTVLYPTPDLARGKTFYTQMLGKEPYFDQPFYVGYEVGGFELGLLPDATPGQPGSVAYWGVPDAGAELARLIEIGAELRDDVQEVGEGIKVAAVLDPFGNVFEIIENPQFDKGKVG